MEVRIQRTRRSRKKSKPVPSIKERLARLSRHPMWRHPAAKWLAVGAASAFTLIFIGVVFAYLRFARLTDEKLEAGPIANSAMLFGAPRKVSVGDEVRVSEIVAQLGASGYTDSRSNRLGWYNVRPDAVEIFPGKDSFAPGEDAVVKVSGRRVSQIISLRDNTPRTEYSRARAAHEPFRTRSQKATHGGVPGHSEGVGACRCSR